MTTELTNNLIIDCAMYLGMDMRELAVSLGVQPNYLYRVRCGAVPLADKLKEKLAGLLMQRYRTYDPETNLLSLLRRLGVDMGIEETEETKAE